MNSKNGQNEDQACKDNVQPFQIKQKVSDRFQYDMKNDVSCDTTPEEPHGSSFIGEYLFELWKNQCLCDVKLQTGEFCYKAHKIVLAAFSEVFCSPKSSCMPPAVVVQIPGTNPDALYQVLKYLYTSEMELTDSSLEPVMAAACFMGISDVMEMVNEILSNPTLKNVECYLQIRQRLGMSSSLLEFLPLVRENFVEVSNTCAFLNMSLEEIDQLLEDPCVMVDSELDTLEAMVKWVEHCPSERVGYVGCLLNKISLECIDPGDLSCIVDAKKSVFSDPRAQEVLMEAFKALAITRKKEDSLPKQGENKSSFFAGSSANANSELPDSSGKSEVSCDKFIDIWTNEKESEKSRDVSEKNDDLEDFNKIRQKFADRRRKDNMESRCAKRTRDVVTSISPSDQKSCYPSSVSGIERGEPDVISQSTRRNGTLSRPEHTPICNKYSGPISDLPRYKNTQCLSPPSVGRNKTFNKSPDDHRFWESDAKKRSRHGDEHSFKYKKSYHRGTHDQSRSSYTSPKYNQNKEHCSGHQRNCYSDRSDRRYRDEEEDDDDDVMHRPVSLTYKQKQSPSSKSYKDQQRWQSKYCTHDHADKESRNVHDKYASRI